MLQTYREQSFQSDGLLNMDKVSCKKPERYLSRQHSKEEKKNQLREWKKRKLAKKREDRRHKKLKHNAMTRNVHEDNEESERVAGKPKLCSNGKEKETTKKTKDTDIDKEREIEKIITEEPDLESKSVVQDKRPKSHKVTSRGEQMVMIARSKSKTRTCIDNKQPGPLRHKSHTSKQKKVATDLTHVREIDPSLISKTLDEPIGCGSYGTVYLATYRKIKVVVKEIKMRNASVKEDERCRQEVLHEAEVLHRLGDHPGLPLLLGVQSVKNPYSLILQFHGDETESRTLHKAIKKKLFCKLQTVKTFRDICLALQYIHNMGYLHNDLKTNNVLLEITTDGFQPIIIDFGKSKQIEKGEERRRNPVNYLAPEVIEGGKETKASDIYSFGKMLEVAVSHRSFHGCFTNLITQMLSLVPDKRPLTEAIVHSLNSLLIK